MEKISSNQALLNRISGEKLGKRRKNSLSKSLYSIHSLVKCINQKVQSITHKIITKENSIHYLAMTGVIIQQFKVLKFHEIHPWLDPDFSLIMILFSTIIGLNSQVVHFTCHNLLFCLQ